MMQLRQIERFYPLGQGKAGHYVGQADVRCYRPPSGYSATAELIEVHPFTNNPLAQSEWWIFLTPDDLI
jgi:hypothetical protein